MRSRLSILVLLAPLGSLACASSSEPSGAEPDATDPVLSVRVTQARGAATLEEALPDEAGAHLAISLRLQDEAGLAALLRDQQDPASPRYHAWVTPQEYGARFGLPEATYARVVDWLAAEGFAVSRYPNRLFVEATGTVRQVRALLGVQLRSATRAGKRFRSYGEDLRLPADIAPLVLKVGGLDTRVRLRHHMNVTWQGVLLQVLDADDIRTLYDIPSAGASGLTLVVLGTQEGTQPNQNATPGPPFIAPSTSAIQLYLTSISHATATYNPIVLPNSDDDYDFAGSNAEYQLDVEMQSVGAPDAKDLDLVLSPASVVLQTGAQYVVNSLGDAVAVSTSLGICEAEEIGYDGGALSDTASDAYLMKQAVQQGLAEGQTWFAASGDTGADDCDDKTSGTGNGFGGGNATVDFPCSLPEVVCVGGTEFKGPGTWSASGALTGYVPEVACNEGAKGVGGGGGQSMLYPKPSWQAGVGPEATDGQRDVPDLALIAASIMPGIVDYDCGEGQDACPDAGTGLPGLDIVGGTSASSPLAAGIFAHVAGAIGCRLGDIHGHLYALGAAQQSGGAQPFHDITSGDNSWVDPHGKLIAGFTAGVGYDLATGWGSLDTAKLIAAWPSCAAGGGSSGEAGSSTSPGTTKGCTCTAAGAGSSGAWPGAGLALGLAALRCRRRGARSRPA
jgi:subtilase family serine protease